MWTTAGMLVHSSNARAFVLNCGEYAVEGRVQLERSRVVIIANRGTKSETRFALNGVDRKTRELAGANARLDVRLATPCNYECVAKLVALEKPLEPFERPQKFAGDPGAKSKSIPCAKK